MDKRIQPNEQPSRLIVTDLCFDYGKHRVLHNVNFDIRAGQIVGIVGPSGCGKSTLLNCLVGTHPPTSGDVTTFWNGEVRKCTSPNHEIGRVYQDNPLFPFFTAERNVAIGPIFTQTNFIKRANLFKYLPLRKKIMEESRAILKRVGLEDQMRSLPKNLSGGQKQRVAIAQSIIMRHRVLLMDEPFASQDESSKEQVFTILLEMYQENLRAADEGVEPPHTVLIVTHEISAAIYVGDRILGLSQFWDGRSACPGSKIVYDQPAPTFAPDEKPDFTAFAHQHEEIRNKILPKAVCEANVR